MTGPVVAVDAVAVLDEALLLVRRGRGPAAGEWSVPGGHVETGETLHVAVVTKKVFEETGLEVVVDRFLGMGGADGGLAGPVPLRRFSTSR